MEHVKTQAICDVMVFEEAANVLPEDRRHQRKREVFAQVPVVDRIRAGDVDFSSCPSEESYRRELRELVNGTLDRLPRDERQSVEIILIEGIPATQAARIAGCSYYAMRDRLARGLAKLRRRLAVGDEWE